MHNKKLYTDRQKHVKKIEIERRKEFEENYIKKYQKLTREDILWIEKYTSFDSYSLNYKLRNGIELSQDDINFMNGLDVALSKIKKHKGDVIRVVDIDDLDEYNKFVSMFEKNKIITTDSYWSSSKKEGYNDEASIRIYINSKNGRDISIINYEEQEVLFMRNSQFKCNNKIEHKDGCDIFLTEV